MISDIKFVNILNVNNDVIKLIRMWRNSDNIKKNMINQEYITEEMHQEWINKIIKNNYAYLWVIYYFEEPIGIVNLQNIDIKMKKSEWGIYIGDISKQGKGIGKQILFSFLEMFFEDLNFNELITKVLLKNIVAINLYKKFNFQEKSVVYQNNKEILVMYYSKKNWLLDKESFKNEIFKTKR